MRYGRYHMSKNKDQNLEDTQQLRKDEIEDALEEDTSESIIDRFSDSVSKPMIIGIIILIIFLFILFIVLSMKSCTSSNKTKEDNNTVEVEQNDSSSNDESSNTKLDYFYVQQAATAINSTLTDKYGTSGFTKPTTEQYKISGQQSSPTIEFTLTVTENGVEKNVTCKFNLSYNEEDQTYKVVDYTIDDSKAEVSNFKPNTSEEEAKKRAIASTGTKVSSYDISVSNSVTVTITSKGSGTVRAVAVASDGNETEIANITDGTTTKTVDLEAGDYELALYADEGTGYSWSYTIQ